GTVTDEYGLPLPGVNIIIKKTSTGTQTDFDGNYSINGKKGETLVFSYVGYETQEVKIGDANRIDVNLEVSDALLESVVVTARGDKKKKSITSANVFISSEAIEESSGMDISYAFQGRAAGVQITNNS